LYKDHEVDVSMLELETVVLDRIRTDGGTQPREYLNELVLSEYTEALAYGAEFPAVTLFYDGSHYWLADGFHRFFAAKKHGTVSIPAEVRQGTRRDAVLYAAGANATHGLRRTNADKRRAVLTLLKDVEWQRWSNREIARQCGVTHTFVGKLRTELLNELSETVGEEVAPSRSTPVSEPVPEWEEGTSLSRVYDEPATGPSHDDAASRPTPLMYGGAPPLDNEAASHTDALAVPALHVPRDHAVASRQAGGPDVSIEELAAASGQRPADWMAEMIVYWLLDLAKQYSGITPALVQQAAAQLVQQYDRAREEIAAVR
jgi:hypothetical protein